MDPKVCTVKGKLGLVDNLSLRRKTALYKELVILNKMHSKYVKKNVKLRVNVCLHLAKLPIFADSKLHLFLKIFFRSQLRNAETESKSQSYDLKDKIVSLLLFNQNPKAYPFLSKIFALPSLESLGELLQNVSISEPIFLRFCCRRARLTSKRTPCILTFFEIALQPPIQFTQSNNLVEVLVDGIADHVMVWKLWGIAKRWKQPFAYNFSQSTTSAVDIVRTYKENVRKARKTGLSVVASICDQSATNTCAINILLEESKRNTSKSTDESSVDETIVIDKDIVRPYYNNPMNSNVTGLRPNALL